MVQLSKVRHLNKATRAARMPDQMRIRGVLSIKRSGLFERASLRHNAFQLLRSEF